MITRNREKMEITSAACTGNQGGQVDSCVTRRSPVTSVPACTAKPREQVPMMNSAKQCVTAGEPEQNTVDNNSDFQQYVRSTLAKILDSQQSMREDF